MAKLNAFIVVFLFVSVAVSAQVTSVPVKPDPKTEKARAVVSRAIEKVGGDAYLNVRNSVGEGKLSVLKGGGIGSYMEFIDVIIYPDRERTDFEEGKSKTVQVNTGETGWIYDESLERFGEQTPIQIEGFRRSIRSHYDYLLRGVWEGKAELSYVGRRQASLGKRNDVVKLAFEDGFWVEYEFDDEGLPMKTLYSTMNAERQELREENRYARWITSGGVYYPSVVDHYINDQQAFRATFDSMLFNQKIPDEIFVKPDNVKKLKKKLKL